MQETKPPETIPKVKGQLSKHQILAVARMAALGAPLGAIAASVGKQPRTIAKWLSPEGGDERILRERARYEADILKHHSTHHYNMLDRYERALAAIDDGLAPSTDIRVRLETSRFIMDEIRPPKGSTPGVGWGGDNVDSTTELSKFLGAVTGLLEDIRGTHDVGQFRKSIAEGASALPPAAAVTVEVTDTEEEEFKHETLADA